ncbi:STAS domain-containing protein [Mycobacterium sp.]|uniref:STAS domain-containing protein n=1 Tax=Mycobacterium sp. TaxID=1785 RepID=UPI002C7F9453|nr:STAS domain-containing protein [Mycobacterium sp.]HME47659.1 STAS domain-containing protein [Mycobacterium sp.]
MNVTSLYGNPAADFGGAQIRAHYRHLATVVTVRGEIDAVNVDRISEYTRRLILAENPLVLDLGGVDYFGPAGVSLLYSLDADCRDAGLEWTLVASRAVTEQLRAHDDEAMFPIAHSVHEVLHQFADVIARRRQLLLPLVKKTA